MNHDTILLIGYASTIALTITIILMGIFVWIPTAQSLAALRSDELTWLSNPNYCELQKKLCQNGTSIVWPAP